MEFSGGTSPAHGVLGTALYKVGHYNIGATIGSGTFGKVKYGEYDLTGSKVAIKILNRRTIKNLHMVDKIKREISNLQLFRHPHIIKLYQVISSPTDIFMIMEYAAGGELFTYIKSSGKLEENEARRFFQQIISGVDYCHRHMVVHRDLKPENLLLDHHHNVKIADFGLSNIMVDGEFLHTRCGSPNYAAPEIISGTLYAGPEVDIWSCGIILFALLCGYLPFDDKNELALFRKIKGGFFQIPDYINLDVAFLLRQMIHTDPLHRITAEGIRKNAWFSKDLPSYLYPPPPNEHDDTFYDESAIQEVVSKLQVTASEVKVALGSGDSFNHLNVAYHLIVDNRRFDSSESSNSDLPHRSSPIDVPGFGSVDAVSVSVKSHPERTLAVRDTLINNERIQGHGKGVFAKRSQWHLGIRSHSKPMEIMKEVYKAMKALNFEWKVINTFNVHVRRKNITTGSYVLMSLQLYGMDHKSNLLDFKVISPESSYSEEINENYKGHYVMEFFEMCAALITELAR